MPSYNNPTVKTVILSTTLLVILLSSATAPRVAITQAHQRPEGGMPGATNKKGIQIDIRSPSLRAFDRSSRFRSVMKGQNATGPGYSKSLAPQVPQQSGNIQVNDPSADNIQVFPGFPPLVKSHQSETSMAVYGRNIVGAYNDTASMQWTFTAPGPPVLGPDNFLIGFSTSTDGGQTWTAGHIPRQRGSVWTGSDPTVGVDRRGNFYVASIGGPGSTPDDFTEGIQVSKSTDGGLHWNDAIGFDETRTLFQDKPWLAVGPDPNQRGRDNLYVAYTSFREQPPFGSYLSMARSTDEGATWSAKPIFVPSGDPNPANPQNVLQSSNPYVDPVNGRLYVPFVHFSFSDQDFIRMLVSDDAGETFQLVNFNIPSAPDPTLVPIVQSGELNDCGTDPEGGFRLVVHSGPDAGGGRFGAPRYVNVSLSWVQPAFAARNGALFLAWANSTSPFFGEPGSGSNITLIRSDDGGASWTTPVQVNPTVGTDVHHILPSLTLSDGPNDVHVAYYTQHVDGTLDVDLANSDNGGASFPADLAQRVTSFAFTLAPSNIPSPTPTNPYLTVNYDSIFPPCLSLGEYISAKAASGKVYVLWGDSRNVLTEPINALDPISGQTHPQEDVFFQAVTPPHVSH